MADSYRIPDALRQEELESLRQFFGAYFHQDWVFDATEPDHIIQRFIQDQGGQQDLNKLAQTIEEYAATREDDLLEKSLFSELWCYYLPNADGMSARTWLKHVAFLINGGTAP